MLHPCSVFHSHTGLVVRAVIRKLVTSLALKKNVLPYLLLGHFLLLLRCLADLVPGSTDFLLGSKCVRAQPT